MESILSGQLSLGFFPGDFAGVALGHDLNVLVIELIEQVEDARDGKSDGGNQGIDDPKTVQSLRCLLDAQGFQFRKIGGLDADPVKQTQQEQCQGRLFWPDLNLTLSKM